MAVEQGLVDFFCCAAQIEGPRFTRMAKRSGRYDCSRLDRMYLSRGADWIEHVHNITHHTSSALSDHGPVTMSVQVTGESGAKKPENYFKMNHFELADPGVMQPIKEAWANERVQVQDDRRRWARSWHRVKIVLQEVRKQREQKRRLEGSVAAEVAWRKSNLSTNPSEAEIEALADAEKRLKVRELEEARIWRVRNRERWLTEDDAPSRYFFVKLKARWSREKIEARQNREGDVIIDKQEVLDEIQEFYQSLFSAEEDSEERSTVRNEVVQLIDKQLTREESAEISRVPSKEEVHKVVFDMKTNKAPGLDGLTVEVLQLCWEFTGDDCYSPPNEAYSQLTGGWTVGMGSDGLKDGEDQNGYWSQ
ncbi:hypothetical protein R1sor_022531 [Riccia sorocarpa]|uniref:Endonuclease/exonuclease/phosphatase domain-containing protein n=1 Tax=Riccia sorocarpa TaxID=122646 RepID=A0ABD3GK40_9MARC